VVSLDKLDGKQMSFSLYIYDEGSPKVLIYVGRVDQNNETDLEGLNSFLRIKPIHDA
jgi:hypothetical protein